MCVCVCVCVCTAVVHVYELRRPLYNFLTVKYESFNSSNVTVIALNIYTNTYLFLYKYNNYFMIVLWLLPCVINYIIVTLKQKYIIIIIL